MKTLLAKPDVGVLIKNLLTLAIQLLQKQFIVLHSDILSKVF